ncbi:MAG: hypothetical protein J2P19_26125, partial [Pseudonocardia sp.]|nr:hypothetical protein [Pseudonocardia sp.]
MYWTVLGEFDVLSRGCFGGDLVNSMPVGGLSVRCGIEDQADLIVRNGKVFTGDAGRPAVSAVSVRAGKVVSVGDDADVA